MNARHTHACTAILTLTAVFAAAQENGPFDGLRFREIGPATPAGRIDDFAVLQSNPAVFYVGTATGGIWKTTNNGTTFETVFDDQTTSSIGDLAIAPEDPNLVWVGTGENNNRQSSSWGDGVYKSTDGGKTWKNMGLRESMHIARIVIDPTDLDVVYVAALGSLWGAGGERGVYKTGRRRRELRARPARRRRHWRDRARNGPEKSEGALRGDVSEASAELGIQRRRTPLGDDCQRSGVRQRRQLCDGWQAICRRSGGWRYCLAGKAHPVSSPRDQSASRNQRHFCICAARSWSRETVHVGRYSRTSRLDARFRRCPFHKLELYEIGKLPATRMALVVFMQDVLRAGVGSTQG